MDNEKLILPGASAPAGEPQIFVPGQYATHTDDMPEPRFICRVPTNREDPREHCGALFFDGQEQRWQAHVGKCARDHEDVIRAHSMQGTMFDPNEWDPEIEAHMNKVGERMKKEGRLIVRSNERAGF